MAEFYSKKGAASAALIQERAATLLRQTPPENNLGTYEKSAGGTGALALLENIINESKETEKDAQSDETDAQLAYEEFLKGTNKSIEAMKNQIVNDEEVKAKETKKE